MAEIAGSAVGVVSLGIQVCQGLLQYYGDWKGYHKDIEASHKAVQGLTETFVLLAQVLNGNVAVNDDQRRNVENCVASCEDSVGHLKDRLAELRKHEHPTAFREKVKASGSRLLYPFKKESLDVLRKLVQEILQRLMLAMNVLNADVGLEMRTAVASMQTDLSSLGQSSADILKAVRDLADKLNGVAGYMVGFQQSFDLLTVRTGQTAFDIKQLLTFEEARRRQDVLNWLAAPDPAINHMAARKQHQPDTCQWLLMSQQYNIWRQGQSPHLWLHGKAGCCKTVLSSTIIEHLSFDLPQQPGVALAYFYFSFVEPQKQSYYNMLLSFVWQLSREGKLLPELAAAYAAKKALGSKDLEDMVDTLAERYARLLIVIDALDEVPEGNSGRQDVLDGLQMLSTRCPNVHFLVTSRPDADITDFMGEWQIVALPIDEKAVNADIELHVKARLSEDRRFRGKEWVKMRQEILDTFQQKAQGMFRWATCQLEDLAAIKICTPKYIRARLTGLPRTLPATYERMLTSIEEEYIDAARNALIWLAFAQRELTLQELEETYIIQPGMTPAVDEENRAPPGSIIRVLKSLVVVGNGIEDSADNSGGYYFGGNMNLTSSGSRRSDEDTDVRGNNAKVRLAHYSVKEYFMSTIITSSPVSHFALLARDAHKYIVQCCLAYFVYQEELIWQSCEESDGWAHDRNGPLLTTTDSARLALLRYTAKFWLAHEHLVEQTDGSNADNVAVFMRTHRKLLRILRSCEIGSPEYHPSELHQYGMMPAESPMELAMSRWPGPLPHTLRALCAAGEYVNTGFPFQLTLGVPPLLEAVRQHDETMVSILIEFGADMDCFTQDFFGHHTNPLVLACGDASYSRDMQKLLLESGADVNACNGNPGNTTGSTPLSAAVCARRDLVQSDHLTPIETLLNREQDAYARDSRTIIDRVDLVDMLLRYGADVGKSAGPDGNLLVTVVRYDDGQLTTRFLKAGALVNGKGHEFYPLEEAVRYCNHAAAKLLLEAGADPAHGWKALLELFQGDDARPELCRGVSQARVNRILPWSQILLAIDSTPCPIRAREALASYAWTGYPELVSSILPFVTDVNYRDDRAGSPLYEANRELKWRCDIAKPDYDPVEESRRFGIVIDLLGKKGGVSLPPVDPSRFEDHTDDSSQIDALSRLEGGRQTPAIWHEHGVLCPDCDRKMECFGEITHEDSHDFVAITKPRQLRHRLVTARRILQDPRIRRTLLEGAGKGLVVMELGLNSDFRAFSSDAASRLVESDSLQVNWKSDAGSRGVYSESLEVELGSPRGSMVMDSDSLTWDVLSFDESDAQDRDAGDQGTDSDGQASD
ncbi:hypothetical protein LTR81_005891 [Elasticomyces elasticus]